MLPKKLTERMPLGESGLFVSPVCLGRVTDPGMIETSFDAGVNFFFLTADMHWPLYEASREGIRRLMRSGVPRDEFVVAAAAYVAQPEFTVSPFLELAEAIPGLDRVDVYVAGGCYDSDLHEEGRITIYRERSAENRRRGSRGRASGASFHSRPAALLAINDNLVDIAFVRCNPLHAGARFDLFPRLRAGTTPLVFNFRSTGGLVPPGYLAGLLGEGAWEPGAPDHYRFALSEPRVDGLLCSPRSERELRAMAEAMAMPPLEREDFEHMIEAAHRFAAASPANPSERLRCIPEDET